MAQEFNVITPFGEDASLQAIKQQCPNYQFEPHDNRGGFERCSIFGACPAYECGKIAHFFHTIQKIEKTQNKISRNNI